MITVLEVSIVERWAAEAYLVVAIPNALKLAIEIIIIAF
jgi:energy-converting hydrogenase Eha subunit C